MPDLHSRIASELSRRLEVAKAASQWDVQTIHVYMDGSAQVRLAAQGKPAVFPMSVLRGPDAQFFRDTEPAAEIRRYSSALRVLERHRPMTERRWVGVGTLISRDPEVRSEDGYATETECAGCDIWTNDGGGYLLFVECEEIRDLAASLGLDTEGSTTDG